MVTKIFNHEDIKYLQAGDQIVLLEGEPVINVLKRDNDILYLSVFHKPGVPEICLMSLNPFTLSDDSILRDKDGNPPEWTEHIITINKGKKDGLESVALFNMVPRIEDNKNRMSFSDDEFGKVVLSNQLALRLVDSILLDPTIKRKTDRIQLILKIVCPEQVFTREQIVLFVQIFDDLRFFGYQEAIHGAGYGIIRHVLQEIIGDSNETIH